MGKKKRINLTEEQNSIADDLEKASALDSLAISDGGKILVSGLIDDVVGVVETLTVKYPELKIEQFISLSAMLKEKLDLARAIVRSSAGKKILEQALKESLAQ